MSLWSHGQQVIKENSSSISLWLYGQQVLELKVNSELSRSKALIALQHHFTSLILHILYTIFKSVYKSIFIYKNVSM